MPRQNIPVGCLPLAILVFILILFPLFLAHVMPATLDKLGFGPSTSLLVEPGVLPENAKRYR